MMKRKDLRKFGELTKVKDNQNMEKVLRKTKTKQTNKKTKTNPDEFLKGTEQKKSWGGRSFSLSRVKQCWELFGNFLGTRLSSFINFYT